IHRVFQPSPLLLMFMEPTEKLLGVIIIYRSRQKAQHVVIFQISLEFCQILVPPCTENIVCPAPLQEFPGRLGKRHALQKVLVIHMDYFMNTFMDPVIDLGTDHLMKRVCHFFLVIQLYRSDFYDLERYLFVGPLFSSGALIPFQIKHNIVHKISLSLFFAGCRITVRKDQPRRRHCTGLRSDIPGISLYPSLSGRRHWPPSPHSATSGILRERRLWPAPLNSPRPVSENRP